MRLRTDFWIAVLLRRVEAAGAYVSVARKGAAEAGAIFVTVDGKDGSYDLYGPAPQTAFGEQSNADRLFSPMLLRGTAEDLQRRIESELRFDPDLWLIDIEDRQHRPFVEIAPE